MAEYKPHGFQDKNQLLEALVTHRSMTFFPEFNLLAATYHPDWSSTATTAIFNVTTPEITSGFFFGADAVVDMVLGSGRDKAFAFIDSCESAPRADQVHMLADLFAWSPTITGEGIHDMIRAVSNYQNQEMSKRESFELSHGRPLAEMAKRDGYTDPQELLDKLTANNTVSYFPEFNLLVTTTEFDPSGLHDRATTIFNVFPSELAYEKLFHGFENVVDIPYSGPVIDPIDWCGTFCDAYRDPATFTDGFRSTFTDGNGQLTDADVTLANLAMLLSGHDVISTQSVPELLETMADRFGIEPEERAANARRARADECVRTGKPDIQVEVDRINDDLITGTVTVEGETCHFYRPNNSRDREDYDGVILEPCSPRWILDDPDELELFDTVNVDLDLVKSVVSVETEQYMDPDRVDMDERTLDSICDEKSEMSESMSYGMEGVGLPMLDAAEHLANY